MTKSIVHIFRNWRGEKDLSDTWRLDRSPTGNEELLAFGRPELLSSPDDHRRYLDNVDYGVDILEKRRFAKLSYGITRSWLIILPALVLFQGYEIWGFELDSSEFIAVVTTTTASFFGFSHVVGKYLYGPRREPPTDAKSSSVETDKNA